VLVNKNFMEERRDRSRSSFNEDVNPKNAQGAKITGDKTKWKNR